MPKSTKVLVQCLLKVLSRRKFRNLVIKHDSLSNALEKAMTWIWFEFYQIDAGPLWKYWGIPHEDGNAEIMCPLENPQEEALKAVLIKLGVKAEVLQNVRNTSGVSWTLGIEKPLCPRSAIPIEINTRKTAWNRPRDHYHRFCEYWVSYLLMIS